MSEVRNKKGQFSKGNMSGNHFKKGDVPWNKGTVGVCKKNKGSFTSKDMLKKAEKSVGKPKFYSKGVVCLVDEFVEKKDHRRKDNIYKFRKRIPYSRWVLLQNGIEVPKGYVVYHKDGDNTNNEFENLEVISRGELMKRNSR